MPGSNNIDLNIGWFVYSQTGGYLNPTVPDEHGNRFLRGSYSKTVTLTLSTTNP
jgi:hypothetical protein